METTERKPKKFSFVSLLTDDSYLPGILTLTKSLKKRSEIPLRVMITSEVSQPVIQRIASVCEVIAVEKIISPFPSTSSTKASWSNSELSKLNLWNMTEFDKVVYIDADCLVVSEIDELFQIESPFAAAPDIFPPDKFNAGVLVVTPNAALFQAIVDKVGTLDSYDGGDTGFLNAYFPDWYQSGPASRLPFGFNAQRTLYWFTHRDRPGYWNAIQPLKIIHFSSSPKPWECGVGGKGMGDLEFMWWQESMS